MKVNIDNLKANARYEVRVQALGDSARGDGDSEYTTIEFSTKLDGSFIEFFCEEVASVITSLTGCAASVALLANYDSTSESDLQITVCPRFNEVERSGRGLLKDRVGVSVVFQKRVPYQTIAECADVLCVIRECVLKLADQDVTVGLPYSVELLESPELFDQNQLEENNVFTSVIDVTYVVTATHG